MIETQPVQRVAAWKWYICCLLMMATVINYMDRLTLNILSVEVRREFQLSHEQYGDLERAFGIAYAVGALFFGWLLDRIGVYWLYPVILTGWSVSGFLTGVSETHEQLLILRFMLGFFEAGHFPCGFKVVQILMEPGDRPAGNGLLQNGSALGSVLAPLVINWMAGDKLSNWRLPFLVIGGGGFAWGAFWFLSVRQRELPSARKHAVLAGAVGEPAFWSQLLTRRFAALVVMVICLNLQWQFFRVWLPSFLQESRGYESGEMIVVVTWYYLAASAGGLAAGFLTAWMTRKGMTPFTAQLWGYAGCCVLIIQTIVVANLEKGPWFVAVLLLVGAGSMGAYSAFNTLTQALSREHQGKIIGLLGTITWLVTAQSQTLFGRYLDQTKEYDLAVGASGCLPMISIVVLWAIWPRDRKPDA